MDIKNAAVHIGHCCKWHGCKYGDPNCPVANGTEKQAYLCEDCHDDLENENFYKEMLKNIEEMKKFTSEHS